MDLQLDLFAPPPRAPWKPEDDNTAWEARFLRELNNEPAVSPCDGMTGCRLEALVARGHASRETSGFMRPLAYDERYAPANPKALKEYIAGFKSVERELRNHPVPLYRYTITDAGRAALFPEPPTLTGSALEARRKAGSGPNPLLQSLKAQP